MGSLQAAAPPLTMEKWVDQISVSFQAYSGYPMPENLEEAWEDAVHLGGEIDRDALMREIEGIFSPDVSRVVSDTYDSTAWGVGGASLEIVLQVPRVPSDVYGSGALGGSKLR